MRFSFNHENIRNLMRELSNGLSKLTFRDNFQGFETEITIPAASVKQIRNEVDFIPSKRIIVRQDVEAAISDSTTEWTSDFVFLENHNATNQVILTVQFLR